MRAVWLALGLTLAASADPRLSEVTARYTTRTALFQLHPADSRLVLPTGPVQPSAPGRYTLRRDDLGARSSGEKVRFVFQHAGYREEFRLLSWDDLKQPVEVSVRLAPVSVSAYFSEYPWLWLAPAAAALLLGGLLLKASASRRLEARNQRFEQLQLSAGAVSKDPLLMCQLGRYRLVSRLGSGGMATVYKATLDESLDLSHAVAIKLIKGDQISDEYCQRFQREIQVSMTMDHPNVVRVLDWGDQDGYPYLVMELVEGQCLKDRLPAGGMSTQAALEVIEPLCQALAYAHDRGVIHRDLKPGNVMISHKGRLKLMDFGLARSQEVNTITLTGQAMGTPAYLPPEQVTTAHSKANLTPLSDQYSLGIMVYEMLTGRRPFEDDDPMSLMMLHLTADPPPVRTYRPELPQAVEIALQRMLARDPARRFPHIREAEAALREALKDCHLPERREALHLLADDSTRSVQV